MILDSAHLLGGLIEIVWLDLILSGDNAVALAWATRALPQNQRRLAVNLGGVGFMLLRGGLALALFICFSLPGVGFFSAALLLGTALWLALRAEDGQGEPPRPRRTVLAAVAGVVAADAAAALFNMAAVNAAAEGDRNLVMLGFALAIPLLALGSAQFVSALRKPPLLWLDAALLGWIAGQSAAGDSLARGIGLSPDMMRFAPPIGALAAVLLAVLALRGRTIFNFSLNRRRP